MTSQKHLPKLANTNLWQVRQEIIQKRLEQETIKKFLAIRKQIEERYAK